MVNGKVVIIGGGTIGTELAVELSESGKSVSIIEMGSELAAKGNALYKIALYQHLRKCQNLDVYLNSRVLEITSNGVKVVNENQLETFIEGDLILLAEMCIRDRLFVMQRIVHYYSASITLVFASIS